MTTSDNWEKLWYQTLVKLKIIARNLLLKYLLKLSKWKLWYQRKGSSVIVLTDIIIIIIIIIIITLW